MKIDCADALTLITGRLFVSVERLYTLYNSLTGDNLYTHQLPRAFKACYEPARRQFPALTEWLRKEYGATHDRGFSDFEVMVSPQWQHLLAKARKQFGDKFEIEPLPYFEHIDPAEELTRYVGTDKIIVVQP